MSDRRVDAIFSSFFASCATSVASVESNDEYSMNFRPTKYRVFNQASSVRRARSVERTSSGKCRSIRRAASAGVKTANDMADALFTSDLADKTTSGREGQSF